MTDFDPYQQWLQIDGRQRPLSHYDLLGVSSQERDEERICQAVNERMALVRRYQLGPQADIALKVIGELSAAFACLSDPEQRRKYDRQLELSEKGAALIGKDAAGAAHSTPADYVVAARETAAPPSSFGLTQNLVAPRLVAGKIVTQDSPAGERAAGLDPVEAMPPPLVEYAANDPLQLPPRAERAGTSSNSSVGAWRHASAGKASRQRRIAVLLATGAACCLLIGSVVAWKLTRRNQTAVGAPAANAAAAIAQAPVKPASPPRFRVADLTPVKPSEGQPISIMLGTDRPDAADWTYKYRRGGETDWTVMTGNTCDVRGAKPGALALEFQAVDRLGQASEVVKLDLEIEKVVLAPSVPPASEPAKTAAEPAAPTTPQPANRPPSVRLVQWEPQQPMEGDDLTALLAGADDEDAAYLKFEYRRLPDGAWLPAADGKATLAGLASGNLSLEFRALDRAGASSALAVKSFEVEPNPAAAWAESLSIAAHAGTVSGLGFRGATGLASAGTDGALKLWNTTNGSETKRINTLSAATGLAVKKDGSAIATANGSGGVELWNPAKGVKSGGYQTGAVGLGFLPGAAFGGGIGNAPFLPAGQGGVGGFGGAPGGMGGFGGLAPGRGNDIAADDFQQMHVHVAFDAALVFARRFNVLFSYQMTPKNGLRQLASWQGKSSPAASTLAKDGKTAVVAFSGTNEVVLYRTQTGGVQTTLTGLNAAVCCVAISPDDNLVAGGDVLGNVIVWDVRSAKPQAQFKAHDGAVGAMALANNVNGLLVTGGEEGKVRLWRVRDGRRLRTLAGHEAKITCAIIESSDDRAATGDAAGKIVVWAKK